jgi:hypothetical protein
MGWHILIQQKQASVVAGEVQVLLDHAFRHLSRPAALSGIDQHPRPPRFCIE